MLLQTNSYFVPKDKRVEHARLLRRFRTALARVGCDHFEVYEQVGSNWNVAETTGRFVHIMRFRDRKHQQAVQAAERKDTGAQAVIQEFCDLINFPYQQQQGLFAVGFYTSVLPVAPTRSVKDPAAGTSDAPAVPTVEADPVAVLESEEPQATATAFEQITGGNEAEQNSMEQGFGQSSQGDFEEAMQRLTPIDVSGAPGQEQEIPQQVQANIVEASQPTASDEPAAPTWDTTAELVEANESEGITDDDALAELESDDFTPSDILPEGASGELAGESTEAASGEVPELNFHSGEEVELAADGLNTELAHPENVDEFTIDDDNQPDSADHHNPGGRALR